jgi:hypothetical protein
LPLKKSVFTTLGAGGGFPPPKAPDGITLGSTFPKGGGGGGIERFLCLCECLINISEKGLVGVGDLERDGVLPA